MFPRTFDDLHELGMGESGLTNFVGINLSSGAETKYADAMVKAGVYY